MTSFERNTLAMRKDAKLSKVPVVCPNAVTAGFSTRTVMPGAFLEYKEHHEDGTCGVRIARAVGRIDASGTDGPPVRGFICAVALSDDGTFCYERWIKPEDVISVKPACPNFFAFFASADPFELLKSSAQGGACAAHMDWLK